MRFIIKPDNNVLQNVIGELGNLNPHKEYQVEIKPYKKNKTAEQRNYFHKLLDLIAEDTGNDSDDLKTRLCFSLGLVKDVTLKDRTVVKHRISTESLTTKQYSALIEAAQIACMSLDIKYPQPEYFGMHRR